jgi:glycosyltransferase involved in cell wall biosynthesis
MTDSNNTPTISVVMSVHNGEKYLREAMESILNQTFRDFEFIIIDDGSTDGSKQILEEYAVKDSRIRLVSRENCGLTKSLNEGIALARGEFIARMDADDVSLPERFEKQVQFLKEKPEFVAVGTGVMMTDCDLRPLQQRGQPKGHGNICRELLCGNGGAMTHPAAMIRRSALQKLGGYDERFETAQDLDLFIRLSEIGQIENLDPVLLLWRQHPQSVNHTKYSTWQSMKRMAMHRAIERQGTTRFVNALFPQNEFHIYAPVAISQAQTALNSGLMRTSWHYAVKALIKGPARLQAVEIICSLVQRMSFTIIRQAYRRLRG